MRTGCSGTNVLIVLSVLKATCQDISFPSSVIMTTIQYYGGIFGDIPETHILIIVV